MIRLDSKLKGIKIPNKDGKFSDTEYDIFLERAFADDTGVGLEDDTQIMRLNKILKEFGNASGTKINNGKCVGIRMGKAKTVRARNYTIVQEKKWYRLGIDEIPLSEKYLKFEKLN